MKTDCFFSLGIGSANRGNMRWINFSCPNIPAINTHDKIIGIDHHVSQKSPVKKQIHKNRSTDHSGGKYQESYSVWNTKLTKTQK